MFQLLLTTVIHHRKQNNLVPDALGMILEAELLKKNKSCSVRHKYLEVLATELLRVYSYFSKILGNNL